MAIAFSASFQRFHRSSSFKQGSIISVLPPSRETCVSVAHIQLSCPVHCPEQDRTAIFYHILLNGCAGAFLECGSILEVESSAFFVGLIKTPGHLPEPGVFVGLRFNAGVFSSRQPCRLEKRSTRCEHSFCGSQGQIYAHRKTTGCP